MRILTFALCLLCFSVSAQNNSINVYPWNPDSDNDNQIGVDDLQSFLTVYGNSFGLPPEPCTYDGTELEEFLAGITDGTIILDSIFIEYELQDFSTFYIVGCPEPVTDTVIFSNSALLNDVLFNTGFWQIQGYDSNGWQLFFRFNYDTSNGTYRLQSQNTAIYALGFTNDGFFGYHNSYTNSTSIPFPEDWYLDEEGIHIESGWLEDDWPYYANYLHILPYWHYADE